MNTMYLYTKCSFLTTKRESFSKPLAAPWPGRAGSRKKTGEKRRILLILNYFAWHNSKKIGPL
jgi:hypothetical protein